MWIVRASLKNPYAISVLALIILVVGLLAWSDIPKDILPVFKAPAVQVMTYYQGMPTGSIEKTITNRIERWTNQAQGCQRVESKSTLGVSVVRLYFRDDIDPNGALTDVNSLALGTLPTLPPNTLPPVVLRFDPTGTLPLGILSVRSPDLDETQLQDLARIDIRNMLGGIPGVVAPAVFGGKQRTILVYVDPQKLDVRKLSLHDVVSAIRQGNLMMTPGVAKFGTSEYQLDSNAMVDQPRDLNDFPIGMQAGKPVYLKDVGEAKDSHAIQTALVRINGHRQVYVPIYRQQGASSLTVVDGVRKAIPDMEKQLPQGVKLDLVMDQSEYVRQAIDSLMEEGVVGAVLVAVMILVFLGNARMTLIASLSILLAVFAGIIGLWATKNTINAMTLGGLALAIGPLVDNAIVVLENTHRHQTLGKSRIKAAFDGATEVTLPVLVATLTTIIVLCPIALMHGMGGFLFRPLTLALGFAMLASFVLSQTLVPAACSRWLAGPIHAGEEHAAPGWGRRLHRRIEVVLLFATRQYQQLLAAALRRRALVLTIVGVLFVASLGLLFGIGREFFPQVDAGQITMFVHAPSGTNIEATEKRIAQMERFIRDLIPARDRKMIVSELGLVPDWSAAYTPNSGSQDAVIKIQLTDERQLTAQEYAILLRNCFHYDPRYKDQFADLRVSFDTGGMISAALNYGASSPIDIQLDGGISEQALQLAQKIRDKVKDVPGTADVHVKQRLDAPRRIIVVDRQKAADVGLNEEEVISQVVTAINSSVSLARIFWIDEKSGNQYFVGVQYPEDPNMKIEDVLNIVATGTNQPYPVKLNSLARLDYASAPVEANHEGLARVFNVLVNTEHRDIGSVAVDVQDKLGEVRAELSRHIRELRTQCQGLENQCAVLRKETKPLSWKRVLQLDKEWPANQRPAAWDQILKLEKERADLEAQDAININVRGEYGRMMESFGSLGFGLLMAALLVYLLLVALFRSYLGPFIIMFAVPLGLIGVLLMLFLTRTTLNVQSSMGVIFMVGIVVANSVLLVDFANKQRRLGASLHEAVTTAAAIRFRPIMMTFLATFLDLLPMAIGIGKGSEANVPLARAVVGGLLTSTFLTLIVVPILYTLLMPETAAAEIDIDQELTGGAPGQPAPAYAGGAAGATGNLMTPRDTGTDEPETGFLADLPEP